MCECMNWCRDMSEYLRDNGRLKGIPISNHHPRCKLYKTKRYVRLKRKCFGSFIDTPENQERFLANESVQPDEWVSEDIYLTDDQFEKLDEYNGL